MQAPPARLRIQAGEVVCQSLRQFMLVMLQAMSGCSFTAFISCKDAVCSG